jgi:hypothetical protein
MAKGPKSKREHPHKLGYLKVCSKCKCVRPLTAFYQRRSRTGLPWFRSMCKKCDNTIRANTKQSRGKKENAFKYRECARCGHTNFRERIRCRVCRSSLTFLKKMS